MGRGILRLSPRFCVRKEGPLLRISLRSVLPLFLLSSSFPAAMLAQAKPVSAWPAEPFAATAAQIKAASAAVPVDPKEPVQILLLEGVYRVSEDGRVWYRSRVVYRVDSQDAVDGWSEISMNWDPWYEKPADLRARVMQADGKFAELDQKTITDAPIKESEGDSSTYSSEHTRRAPLPGVKPGAIVEEVEISEEKLPYFAGGVNYRYFLSQNNPVREARLTVETPSSKPFHDVLVGLPGLTPERTEANGTRTVQYVAWNLPSLVDEDIDLKSDETKAGYVSFATGSSWGELAKEYAAMTEPQTVESEAAAILPKELPSDRSARIKAIVAALHAEIRYTGVEFGEAKLTPQRPAEVIKRHYGDCKDKATLLVAMLRAAKIPAELAVLNTGPGLDVQQDLPGMSEFDHVIVYLPEDKSSGGGKAMWIDATAQYNAPGSLPFMDRGRYALLVAGETTGLVKIPEAQPEDSTLVEMREYLLAPYGPSRVVETSMTSGEEDAQYRDMYASTEEKKVREGLEKYVRGAYNAKSLSKVTHGKAEDLNVPFALRLEADGAKRGATDMTEAVAVTFANVADSKLPRWFSTKPEPLAADASAASKKDHADAVAARRGTYRFEPFVEERRVKVVPPAGFLLRSLPENKTTPMGKGKLVETYTKQPDGSALAVLRFESGPGTLTADEAVALRSAVLAVDERDYIAIYFDAPGAKDLAAGRVRPAIEANEKLIAANPSDAMNHLRLAKVLQSARMSDEAKKEARKATELDPKSAVAWKEYADTLKYDSLGVQYGKGYDRAGAVAASQKAIELDPEDGETMFSLAVLYEYDARGNRYSEGAELGKAVDQYEAVQAKLKGVDDQTVATAANNELYALLFAGRFKEVKEKAMKGSQTALVVAAVAAESGAKAAIAEAEKANRASAEKATSLLTAGTLLSEMRRYALASALLDAGMSASKDAAQTARQVEMYKHVERTKLELRPANDPVRPVQAFFYALFADKLTAEAMRGILSRNSYASDAEYERNIQKSTKSSGLMRMIAAKSGTTEDELLDLVVGTLSFSATGDDKAGWAVLAESMGSSPQHFYVVKEAVGYRIAAEGSDGVEVGNEVLHALERGDAAFAKGLLDWKREQTPRTGGDDPLDGALLPRFWTVGSTKEGADSPEAMRMAAISLLSGSMDAKPYLAEIDAARVKAKGARQEDLDLLLALAAMGAEQTSMAAEAGKRLMEEEPDSLRAVQLMGGAEAMGGHPEVWLAALKPRLEKQPKNHDALMQEVRAYEYAHDWAAARKANKAALDSGKAVSGDYNSYAWMGLFDGTVGDAELKAAQQAVQMGKNSFGDLHTLACVYAVAGKTTEARTVLDEAIYAQMEATPSSEVWFALGLLYEQYGAKGAALAAYRKVEAHAYDDHTMVDPSSSYVLARARIAALEGGAS